MTQKERIERMRTHIDLIDAILTLEHDRIEGDSLKGLQRAFTQLKLEFEALIY